MKTGDRVRLLRSVVITRDLGSGPAETHLAKGTEWEVVAAADMKPSHHGLQASRRRISYALAHQHASAFEVLPAGGDAGTTEAAAPRGRTAKAAADQAESE
jgi:hypothetical protein